jgi:hypothetical protein
VKEPEAIRDESEPVDMRWVPIRLEYGRINHAGINLSMGMPAYTLCLQPAYTYGHPGEAIECKKCLAYISRHPEPQMGEK